MSVQTTFEYQSLYPVRDVTVANRQTPLDGSVRGEDVGGWARIAEYTDAATPLFPFSGRDKWVGGFRLARHDFEYPHEVTVYRIADPFTELDDDFKSQTGVWLVNWTDVGGGDWENVLGTAGYTTPSLRDARRIVSTLLTNLARVDTAPSDWKQAIVSTVERLNVMTTAEYDQAHADGLQKHTPWPEEREQIHANARLEWRNISERRARLFSELQETVATETERGYPVRELLPPTLDNASTLKQQYLDGELSLEEFEREVEQAWANTPFVTFDEYLAEIE